MRLTDRVMREAFDARIGIENGEAWDIKHHVECWTLAHEAFANDSEASFTTLYDHLRSRWQVFRSRNYKAPSAHAVWKLMQALDSNLRCIRLDQLATSRPKVVHRMWSVLVRMARIKTNADGPSVMAVSKFLHFWNPSLFMIVDRGLIHDWVFRHRWIRQQLETVSEEVRSRPNMKMLLSDPAYLRHGFASTLGEYANIILWAARVAKMNPRLGQLFQEYIEHRYGGRVHLPLRRYQGAAIECCLLGLVELPPKGVRA